MLSNNRIRDIMSRSCLIVVLGLALGSMEACSLFSKGPDSRMETVPSAPDKGKRDPREGDATALAYENFLRASLALKQGRFSSAREYFGSALESDPDSPYLNGKMAALLKAMERYQEALPYALKFHELDPENVDALILLADLYALLDKDELAAGKYRIAIGLEPDNQRVRLLLSTILIRQEKFQEALVHLDVLTKQNPELVIAQYYHGRIHLELGDYKKAEKSFEEAVGLKPGLEPALFDLGALYITTGRKKEAVKSYRELLKYHPENVEAREKLADLYMQLGEEDLAQQEIDEIKSYSEPGAPGRRSLGLLYLRQGKLDESIEELELIVSAWPRDYKARYFLAIAYQEKGEFEKAIRHFALIKQEAVYFVGSRVRAAYLLEARGEYDRAASMLNEAIEKKPDAELYLALSSVFEARREPDKAVGAVEKGLALEKDHIGLLFRWGVLLDKGGDKAACLDKMRYILSLEPDNADALNYIGYTYAEQGIRLDEARQLIEKALRIKPESGYIMDSLGWVYFKEGRYEKALHYLKMAVKLTPDDPTINEHVGDIYFLKKEYKKALESYQKALSLEHPDEEKIREKIYETEKNMP